MHAVKAGPAVDIRVDDHDMATGLAFSQFTGYMEVPAGKHCIVVTPTGQGADETLVNSTMNVEDDQAYSVFAVGDAPDVRAVVLTDEREPSSPIQTDAAMRVVNLAPEASAFDVVRSNDQGSSTARGLSATSSSVPVAATQTWMPARRRFKFWP
jgi:hypothetical protein